MRTGDNPRTCGAAARETLYLPLFREREYLSAIEFPDDDQGWKSSCCWPHPASERRHTRFSVPSCSSSSSTANQSLAVRVYTLPTGIASAAFAPGLREDKNRHPRGVHLDGGIKPRAYKFHHRCFNLSCSGVFLLRCEKIWGFCFRSLILVNCKIRLQSF